MLREISPNLNRIWNKGVSSLAFTICLKKTRQKKTRNIYSKWTFYNWHRPVNIMTAWTAKQDNAPKTCSRSLETVFFFFFFFQNQWEQQDGKCGVCGDPYQGPYEHEAGGIYAKPDRKVTQCYNKVDDVIDIHVIITAHHQGEYHNSFDYTYWIFTRYLNSNLKHVRKSSFNCKNKYPIGNVWATVRFPKSRQWSLMSLQSKPEKAPCYWKDLSTVFNLHAAHRELVLCVLPVILSMLSLKTSIERRPVQFGQPFHHRVQ